MNRITPFAIVLALGCGSAAASGPDVGGTASGPEAGAPGGDGRAGGSEPGASEPGAGAAPASTSRVESTAAGELLVIQTVVIDAPLDAVWSAYTTSAGWRAWVAPVADVDLRAGGLIQTHYEADKAIGDPGTNRLHVINYVPRVLLTLQADTSANWPEFMKAEADRLYNVILFDALSASRTRIRSYGVGMRDDDKHRKLLEFFVPANEKLYGYLERYLEDGIPAPFARP